MNQAMRIFGALVLLGLAAGPARGGQISGRVRVVGNAERSPSVLIIYAEALDARPPMQRKRYQLLQKNKSFVPRVLAVPVGSSVEFTNEDLIFHNVFSLSPPKPFDLGLYRAGASKSRIFMEPATYRVFCNIHPQMTGVLLVLATPYITEADASGAYRLELPPGRYRVTAWSERAQPATQEITVSSGAVTVPELVLDESKFVELPHKNKFGQDYSKSAYDPLRDKKPQ